MNRRKVFILFILTGALIFHDGCGSKHSSDPTPPGSTSGFSAPAAISAVAGDGKVTLSWRGVEGATSYKIYMASQSGVKKSNFPNLTDGASVSEAVTPYIRESLVNNRTYYFVVTALNGSEESAESQEVSATPEAGLSGPITISGIVLYEDREYNMNGFTSRTGYYKPVRYADIELADSFGTALASGITGTDGTYSFTVAQGSDPVYVRVISSVSFGGTPGIDVKTLSNNILFSFASSIFTPSGIATVNITVPAAGDAGGAFNILDVYTNAFQFMHSLGVYPPAIAAFWEKGNENGTYYCTGCSSDGIYVLGGDAYGDTDEYDDDVILHEFGHFIADKFSRDQSPGGYHYLTDNDQDLRLSWSEGWGNFFPSAVKKWLLWNDAARLSTTSSMPFSGYVDTAGDSAQIPFDFGNPGGSPFYYASSEVAVANVLVNLLSNFTMQPIMDILQSNAFKYPTAPVNVELLWDSWLQRPSIASEIATVRSKFEDRRIRYLEEGYDSPISALAYSVPVSLGLYPAGSADYAKFTANGTSSYTITTTGLLNGADTFVELVDPDGSTVLTSNDNTGNTSYPYNESFNCSTYDYACHENGDDLLASKITTGVLSSGTYYVKVTSTPYSPKPLSAGKYGNYTLTIK